MSGSTAVFNLDLTENGAGFMKELFVDSSGGGRVDLTPVQVIYNLKMWAHSRHHDNRDGAVGAHPADTEKDLPVESRRSLHAGGGRNVRDTGTNSSTLRETGLVDVKSQG